MSKVYILNNSGNDYSEATNFGELLIVNDGPYSIFNTGNLINSLKTKFMEFNAKGDYLVMSGSPFVAAMTLTLLLEHNKMINVLLFDAKRRTYIPRTIKLDQLKQGESL